jgi:hypothetical protein
MTDFDGNDPYGLGLELCSEPLPAGSDSQLSITLRRVVDHEVLWMEAADSVAQSHLLDGQDPPALQVVVVHEVERTDDEDDTEEDAVYVIDFEYVNGAINEVNRFRDSGD